MPTTTPTPTTPVVDVLTGLTLADIFDEAFYLGSNPDVAATIAEGGFDSALDHFTQLGQFEGRDPSAFFNTAAYLANNADVAAAISVETFSAAFHYAVAGSLENRVLSGTFNPASYLTNNPDVAAAIASDNFDSAAFHFFIAGISEGRSGF